MHVASAWAKALKRRDSAGRLSPNSIPLSTAGAHRQAQQRRWRMARSVGLSASASAFGARRGSSWDVVRGKAILLAAEGQSNTETAALVVRGAVPAPGGPVSSFPFQSVRAVVETEVGRARRVEHLPPTGHVSISPSAIPDGRISRVRF